MRDDKDTIYIKIPKDKKREIQEYADQLKMNLTQTILFALEQMMDADKTYQIIKAEHEKREQFYKELKDA